MTNILFIAVLALTAAFCPAPLAAQANTRLEEQSFDYDPDAGKVAPKLQPATVETTYEDAVIVNQPMFGTVIYSKYRWKNWVTRAFLLMLVIVALISIMLAIPKTEETSMLIAYTLSGASFAVSFWIFLCAVLLYQIDAGAWLYVLPASAASAIACYTVLMKIKQADIALDEYKESLKTPGVTPPVSQDPVN